MIGACGMACDVCGQKEACGGCLPGTDPRAPERVEEIKKVMGGSCFVLECAVNKKVDYCLGCAEFPCEVHYKGIPYSKTLLNIFKKFKESK